MIRTAAVIVAGVALLAPAGQAQGTPPESDDARYSFYRADDGYLRLDGRTGQVSACTRRPTGWSCQALPDERSALEAEIARVQGENVVLKRELLAHKLPLPAGVKPDMPPGKVEGPGTQSPIDPDFNKVVTFIEKVWRRLVEMIVTVQKDLMRKT
jgi:hypothetical protein